MGEYSGEISSCSIGETSLSFRKFEATRNGVKIDLTPLEFQLLQLFVKNKGIVLTREQILEQVWGEQNVVISYVNMCYKILIIIALYNRTLFNKTC